MRVVIADDSVLVREGLARLLTDAGLSVQSTCGDATELLAAVEAARPDVVIIDVRMPPTHTDEGLRAAARIRRCWPGIGVVVLSQYVEVALATDLLADGTAGVGYLLKDRVTRVDEFASAVRRVGEGRSVIDPEVVTQLLSRRRHDDAMARLTPRERQVLELMAEGLSNQAIANAISVTRRSVEKHVSNILDKLGLEPAEGTHRRVVAVLRYLAGTDEQGAWTRARDPAEWRA